MATVMQAVHGFQERTFSSLRIRNYRLYVLGQGISLSGTWMQTIAQGLLVLHLTGSGTDLGIVVALQTLPILFLGPWGGVVADRFPKRSILYVTQIASALLALGLGVLVATDWIELWMLYILALGLGLVNTVDNPTRQTFVLELVGRDELPNAVSLNSTQINLARVIGPSLAGGLVATVGLAACFIVNGVSFLAVILVLRRMREEELHPTPIVARAKGQLAEGFRYVRGTPIVLNTLLMMAIIGTFTYEFQVILPLYSEFTFHDGERGYAAMTAAMGVGAVIGGLITAGQKRGGAAALVRTAGLFGVSVLLTAFAPNLFLAILGLIVVGYCSISFTSLGNVTIQLSSAPEMRGRVMALWTVAFLGSTPIGGPIIGAIGEHAGPRWGLIVGGIAALVAAGLGAMTLLRGQGGKETAVRKRPSPPMRRGA